MHAAAIQRQYDEVIAAHYDFDPQGVTGASLDRAVRQIGQQETREDGRTSVKVLDLGVGTGLFLEKLRAQSHRDLQPYGLDISQKMIDIACTRIPDLIPAVADAAQLDSHFPGISFDLICTHFVTGFVQLGVLAPRIWSKLSRGGYWSFVGGTKAGYSVLQQKADTPGFKALFGGAGLKVDDFVCNPADQREVVHTLAEMGFTVCACETFLPQLEFNNLEDFLDFAYWGGWLTPFVEALGLHQAPENVRAALDASLFPVKDQHHIVIALAQKN
jgi:trans-aconitate methyltransferase